MVIPHNAEACNFLFLVSIQRYGCCKMKLKHKKMKKLIFVLLAAAAFGCGDGTNRSSERQNDETNGLNNREELVEPDTTSNQSDTTSVNSGGGDAGMQKGK